MIFDLNQTILVESVMVYPDWSFNAAPKPHNQIKETIFLQGSNKGGNSSITGSTDDN